MAKIKICGMTREKDIEAANEASPDFVGFVFAPSRRQVQPAAAERLRVRLSPGITPVGVFVNAPVEEVAALYRAGVIEAAQMHGSEDVAYLAALKAQCAAPVIKVFSICDKIAAPYMEAEAFIPFYDHADYFLFDHGSGGTGSSFDWNFLSFYNALREEKPPIAHDKKVKKYFLAGGIELGNIDRALSFAPFAVDISSGAETDGVKDHAKMMRLVSIVRQEKVD